MLKHISLAFFFTFIGKILAFFRVQQLAIHYGQDYWLDAFFIVFSFTSLFDTVLISGAIATTFIPIYLKQKATSVYKAEKLYTNIFSVMFSFFAIVSIFLWFFSYEISLLLVKGTNTKLIMAVDYLMKYFSLFPLLSLLFQLPTIYNQANRKFQLSTLNPILLNGTQLFLIFIVSIYGVLAERDVLFFLIAYMLAMLFCFVLQVYFYRLAQPRQLFSFEFKKLKFFSIAIFPFIIFISIEELNLLVDQYFATSLNEGSVSNLLYASRLIKIFGAVFVASIVTVFYPKISVLLAKGKFKNVRYVSCLIIELLIVFTLPIVFVFYYFSINIANLLYGQGVGGEVSEVLSYYSFLVFTSSIYMIQIRLVYSIGINKSVLVFCVIISALNFILNTIFIKLLGLSGLALSTVLVSAIQVVLFDFYLRSKGMILFSAKMLLRILLYITYLLGLISVIVKFLPVLVNELWLVGVILIMFVYFVTSMLLNKKLYIRLINL